MQPTGGEMPLAAAKAADGRRQPWIRGAGRVHRMEQHRIRAMPRLLVSALASLLLTSAVHAGPTPEAGRLFDALGLGELLGIMREEGIGYGRDLERDLFPGRGNAEWEGMVGEIYAPARMEGEIREGLAGALTAAQMKAASDFFSSEAGQRIIELELAARRALLDEAVEENATVTWQGLQEGGDPRWSQLEEFARVNDLVEMNVAGAMTANYAFYMGLIDGKAFDFPMTEDQVLGDVWSQEDTIRDETTDWVYSFGALAYLPLGEDAFADYIAFAATPDGQALNTALFSTFNDLFTEISRDLGLGAARFIAGQDI
jgi:hypothetical protein